MGTCIYSQPYVSNGMERGFGIKLSRFISQLHYELHVRPWAGHFTSLCLVLLLQSENNRSHLMTFANLKCYRITVAVIVSLLFYLV